MASYGSDTLRTISDTGEVPQTRIRDAQCAQDFARRLIDNDEKRAYKRAKVNGLHDGNPPYKSEALKAAGRSDASNVNWGTARSYIESGTGAFYDLFAEAPGYMTVRTSYGTSEQKETWSQIISEEIDKILRKQFVWDYEIQVCLENMVKHGTGPLLFEDAYAILPRAFQAGDLKVPERTKSDTSYWEAAMVQVDYYPPELYEFVQNEDAATKVGWDVQFTKLVIAHAMDVKNQAGVRYEWEWYQQELKNNSLTYYDDSKICRIAHLFWKEFDGRITHAMVERDAATALPVKYLYLNQGRYAEFSNAIHPMYFDRGNGGFHHSVTGLGVKMYSAMEYQNRLICNLCDKAFAPKIFFKPLSANGSQKFQLARFGDYGVLPAGADAVQNPIAGIMSDGMLMHEALSQLISSNLSTYRSPVPEKTQGNPPTKWQKQYEAAMIAALSKTQFNRFYAQLDAVYREIYRRITNFSSTDKRAQEFQTNCKDAGVPREALQRTDYVGATRVAGQGSAFMRKQAIDSLFSVAGALPEDGRDNLIADKIAAEAGQSAVSRYYPKKPQPMASDQQAEALQWVAAMKVGVPPVVTSSQNPVTYAATFLKAGVDAVQSVKQGGDIHSVLSFLQIDGPAIGAHLKRFANDPTRADVYKALLAQWQQLASVTDQLKQLAMKQAQQQKKQQQKTATAMNDMQLKNMQVQNDIRVKNIKAAAQMKQREERHRFDMSLQDAETAHDIMTKNRMAAFEE